MIGCLQDEKEGLADAKSGQSQKVSVFTTASREEIQAFLKENVKSVQAKRPAAFQKENTNGEGERIIRPLHYVKLLGEEAEAGIVQLMKEGKASQWVFYKQEGKLQANRVRVVRQSGTGKDSSFTGIIEVSALKARAWTAYVYKKDTLEKVYSGNGLLSNASNQCLETMDKLMEPGEGGSGSDGDGDGDDCGGGGGSYFGGYISPVVVTAHRRSPGSSSSSWGSGSSFDSRGIGSSSWGSGVGYPAGPVSPGSWGGGGGGGSYSGDDGESYYGGEIGAVTVTAHKKKKEEPERSGVILSPLPPLLPAGELIDERGEPLREDPKKKKESGKEEKDPCPDGKVKDSDGNCIDKPCNTFENRIKQVINTEGGFVNDPTDKGGATNKGIAWRTWQANAKSVLGVEPTLDNLKNLTDAQAKEIYRYKFWDAISADQINDGDVRYLLFDFYVNSGPRSIKVLQKTLNMLGSTLKVDGGMGLKTLEAINLANPIQLYSKLKQARIDFLNDNVQKNVTHYLKRHPKASERDLKKYTQKRFINGWLNRVKKFKQKDKEHKYNVNCN